MPGKVTVGRLVIELQADIKKMRRDLRKGRKEVQGFARFAKSAFVAGLGVAAVSGAARLGKAVIDAARDVQESENLFRESFGNMASEARRWSEQTGRALGVNRAQLRENNATWFLMLESMGIGRDRAFEMAKGLSQLTLDMASFRSLRPEEAFNKIQAGITGESDSLKRLGILVDEQTIKHEAYAQGIAKSGSQLTQQQKVLARYSAILRQTSKDQGNLARTGSSLVNQERRLQANWEETMQIIGGALLPSYSMAVRGVNRYLEKLHDLDRQTRNQINLQASLALVLTSGPRGSLLQERHVLERRLLQLEERRNELIGERRKQQSRINKQLEQAARLGLEPADVEMIRSQLPGFSNELDQIEQETEKWKQRLREVNEEFNAIANDVLQIGGFLDEESGKPNPFVPDEPELERLKRMKGLVSQLGAERRQLEILMRGTAPPEIEFEPAEIMRGLTGAELGEALTAPEIEVDLGFRPIFSEDMLQLQNEFGQLFIDQNQALLDQYRQQADQAQFIGSIFAGGLISAFDAIGAALAGGDNVKQRFIQAAAGILSQFGSFMVSQGIAEVLSGSAPPPFGPRPDLIAHGKLMILKGAAFAIAGGAVGAFGGRGGGRDSGRGGFDVEAVSRQEQQRFELNEIGADNALADSVNALGKEVSRLKFVPAGKVVEMGARQSRRKLAANTFGESA